MNEIVGVFREEQDGKSVTYSFRAITNEEYNAIKGDNYQTSGLDAAFWVSSTPFDGAEKSKWQFHNGQIVFADRIVIHDAMATEIIPDVVSDMIVEDAIMKQVDVLRIKIEKQSPVSTSLQECDMSLVDSDNEYFYFEVDVRKEAELRTQKNNNQELELQPKQMKLTLLPADEVIIRMAGSGTITIDWGDETPYETFELTAFEEKDWQNEGSL